MKEFIFHSSKKEIQKLQKDVEAFFVLNDVSLEDTYHLMSIFNELIYQYTKYGKLDKTLLKVKIDVQKDKIVMAFLSDNEELNILESKDKETKIAIDVIKKYVNSISYCYENGFNKLTIEKGV